MEIILRLSDILGRNVAMEWFEAVAIVREVADCVDDPSGRPGVPELDQVHISPDGAITLSGTARKDDPVRRLGQLLQACLVQSEPPVQLRLTASQATAPEPAFSSIRDFSDALAYFERPDRRAVIRQLYTRSQSMPSTPPVLVPTLDVIAPLQRDEQKKPVPKPVERQAPRRGVAALAAGVVLVVATTTYTQLGSSGPTQADVSAIAQKASDAVGTTLVKGISAVSETVGLGRLAPIEGTPGSRPAPAVTPPAVAATTGAARRRSTTPSASRPLQLFDLEAVSPVSVGLPVAMPMVSHDSSAALPPVSSPVTAPDETVYSASDPTITPPIGVRPQLPRVLPEEISRDRLSQIELIVLPDGTVGTVKLLGERRSVLEGMLLSAAKAWKFKPAEKDGRPVTYRKTVWLVRE